MTATVCLTFDVDGEAGLGRAAAASSDLLSTRSERRFGVVRGLPRLLDLLEGLELPGTFYVPGATADAHPGEIAAVLERGHELGHHGHDHLREDELTPEEAREQLELGLAALERLGARPRGYRSPAWELTPATLELLREHEFEWDSSCMGDDRPYWEGAPEAPLLELPVHWSLDDWPWFGIGPQRPPGDPDAWLRAWGSEVAQAEADGRVVTLTMHPEIAGRGHRALALERWLADLRERGTRFASHAQVAAELRRGAPS